MVMEAIKYTDFRTNLSQKIKEISENNLGVIVTRKNQSPVVILSLEEYRIMEESADFLRIKKPPLQKTVV